MRPTARRMRPGAITWTVAAVACFAACNVIAAPPPWPEPVASYAIDVRYDADDHTLRGRETVTWRNTAARAASDLRFHLYQNAFANSRSSFLREGGDDWRDWAEEHPDPWGYTEISSIRVGSEERVADARFVQPDDGNVEDRTVLAVPLKTPVAPDETLIIEVEFATRLPRAFARSGYGGPFAMVAQWFPKLGVFGDQGWNCHQYHRTTEFYANFGTYDVTIEVPAAAVVGATGQLREDTPAAGERRRLRFTAEAVHDFALAIDPRFEVVERDIGGVAVRLLLQPAHASQAERYLGALEAAMRYFSEHIAPYPYPTLTLIDPGAGASAAGGMEYPTLITLGTTWWMPSRLRVPEIVAVHEFGHQYWQGMVASNEFEEAWLDEGVNSYFEGRIMDAVYGCASYVDLFGIQVDSFAEMRAAYLRSTTKDPIVRAAWQFLDRRSYVAISYAKTAVVLETLARRFGEDKVTTALSRYFDAWKFDHPPGSDLIKALSRVIGDEIRPFVEQVIYGTGVVDYAVTRVKSTEMLPLEGRRFDATRVGAENDGEAEDDGQTQYQSEVVVERLGEVALPLDIDVRFDDGTAARERWDGEARWKRLEYTGTQRVEWAVVDPDSQLALDVNRINNSRMRQAGTRGLVRLTSRWGFWFQSLLQVLTGL